MPRAGRIARRLPRRPSRASSRLERSGARAARQAALSRSESFLSRLPGRVATFPLGLVESRFRIDLVSLVAVVGNRRLNQSGRNLQICSCLIHVVVVLADRRDDLPHVKAAADEGGSPTARSIGDTHERMILASPTLIDIALRQGSRSQTSSLRLCGQPLADTGAESKGEVLAHKGSVAPCVTEWHCASLARDSPAGRTIAPPIARTTSYRALCLCRALCLWPLFCSGARPSTRYVRPVDHP